MFLAAPLGAQSWEISGLAGYTPPSAIDRRARELNQLDVSGGFTWGVQGRGSSHRDGAPKCVDAAIVGAAARDHSRLHGPVYDHDWATAGAALSIDSAVRIDARCSRLPSPVLARRSSERRRRSVRDQLSLGFGGGVKYFFSRVAGVRGHVRYNRPCSTTHHLATSCDPFGFCQGTLQQVEFAAGAVVRF